MGYECAGKPAGGEGDLEGIEERSDAESSEKKEGRSMVALASLD